MKNSIILLLTFSLLACSQYSDQLQTKYSPFNKKPRVGVLYVSHGGNETYGEKQVWESTVQIFSYDKNSPVYQRILWNPDYWPQFYGFGNATKEIGKYSFEYERIGGVDPYPKSKAELTQHLAEEMNAYENKYDMDFIVDKMSWLSPEIVELANPRRLYYPGTEDGSILAYCGKGDDSWLNCNPDRYDIDGPIERLLKIGVERFIMVDLTTAGARFSKTFDVYTVAKEVIDKHNQATGQNVVIEWVNDPDNLMIKSYPQDASGWTRSKGKPEINPIIATSDYPNPVIEDLRLAKFQAEGIASQFNEKVSLKDTGVLMVNHGIRNGDEVFDPKINDTLTLNKNIKNLLLQNFPELKTENILGGWFGEMVINQKVKPSAPAFTQMERTREMRGENLGYIVLHDSEGEVPVGEWGYRYWEALDQLRENKVKHIVIVFPQIMENSVLNLVEVPNQIAKEIGYKNWLYFNSLDFETYPEYGHPFADYWGIWVSKYCASEVNANQTVPCCFEMGGCQGSQVYPPPRQARLDQRRDDLDPSLAFDVSEYGHLGYQFDFGPIDPNQSVQGQYRGTWAMWQVTDDHHAVAEFLAHKVIQHIESSLSK
jgi:hypothetical protein